MKHTRRIAAVISAAAMTVSMFGLTASAEESSEKTIQQMISSMTTEQKVEQMMMITLRPWSDGAEGSESVNVTTLNEEQKAFIERHNFAGVCLFAPNIHDTAQCVELTDEIQQAALKSECGIPMLIAADQEGGKIYRLQTGTPTCGNMALGAASDPQFAYENAKIIGSEISAIGINTNLAPVLDVNNNPSNPVINLRSFSSDPKLVSEMGVQYIKGLQSEGVVTTVKHFPGHGDTGTDSHTGLPLVDKSYDELKKMELYPYTAAVEAGADMVMTAHIQFPQIETGTYISKSTGEQVHIPATLSKTIITDVLRGDYQFDGVVCTDSMVMDAIQVNFDRVDAAVLAMNADVDIILEPMTIASTAQIAEMEQYITDVVQQVNEGKISVATIDKSVERILTMKQERGILDYQKPDTEKAMQIVGSAEHREKALQIAEKAVTLVKNDDDTLPLKLGENGKVAYFYAYANVENTMAFALERLKKDGVIAEGVTAECNCFKGHKAAEYEDVIKNSDAVILALEMYNTGTLDPTDEARGWQSAFADDLIALAHQLGKKVVYVSAHIPYDVARFTDADAILAAYCANGMDALPVDGQENPAYGVNYPAALITAFGGNTPTGKLPVDVYEIAQNTKYTDKILYPQGYGLTYSNVFTDLISKTLCSSAEKEYQQRTGKTAARSACTFNDAGKAVVTLTDENGNVLDVYTVDVQNGNAVLQNGDKVDLTAYIPVIPEEEYFAAPEYISDVAAKYYKEKTGESPSGSMMLTDAEKGTVEITLSGNDGKTLAVYTIDARTGIGTDDSGNAVDLSVYKDYKPVTEEDYFIPANIIDDAARGYFTEQTGRESAGIMIWYDNSEPAAKITFSDDDDNVLEEYIIDPTTGIGTDSKGNAVDLAAYAKTHDIKDSDPVTETDESAYFAPSSKIMEYAQDEYAKRTGNKPAGVSFSVDNDTMTAEIELVSDMNTVLDCYTIDVRTGVGTDSNGNAVDLSVYVNPEKTLFASVEELGHMAKIDYEKKTGTACYVSEAVLSEDKTAVTVKLTDADGKLLDTYTIDPYTGEGKAESGAAVNLPQTGVTSPKTAATAAGGLLMLVTGWFAMMKSGILRKKDE